MTSIDRQAASADAASSLTGPLAAFALLGLLWGYNWVVMKLALEDSGPIAFATLRVGFGALVTFALLPLLRVPLRPRHVGKTILLGLFQTTGFVGLISWSLALGEAGKSAVLAYTMPFWVILLGWPFLGERLRGLQWPAVGLALAGLIFVLEIWKSDAGFANNALAIAAGASWGISVIVVKRIPIDSREELVSLTAWQMAFGSIPLIAAALLVPERPIEWTPYFVGALAYNAIGGTAIAMLLWLYILQRLPATISGLSSLIVPIIGVVSAWLQLGERPSAAEGAGIMLILAALALLARAGREPGARTPEGV